MEKKLKVHMDHIPRVGSNQSLMVLYIDKNINCTDIVNRFFDFARKLESFGLTDYSTILCIKREKVDDKYCIFYDGEFISRDKIDNFFDSYIKEIKRYCESIVT